MAVKFDYLFFYVVDWEYDLFVELVVVVCDVLCVGFFVDDYEFCFDEWFVVIVWECGFEVLLVVWCIVEFEVCGDFVG